MMDRATDIARAGIHAAGELFAGIGALVRDWMRGDDLTLLIGLGVVALVALFVFLPGRRRY